MSVQPKQTGHAPDPVNILLVEDNAFDRELFLTVFGNSCFNANITPSASAEEAFRLLRTKTFGFHIIVVDQTLPGITGLDLCIRILNEGIDLPIVIVTGTGTEEIAAEAIRLGVQDYIIKGSAEHKELLPLRIVKAVSEHKNRNKLHALNRALASLSQSTQAVMHAKSEPKLLNEICRIITETGGYLLAWVGYAEYDKNKSVRVMAKAGTSSDYLRDIKIVWSDTRLGRGPTGKAIRTGEVSLLNNLAERESYAPWLEKAEQFGIKSSIALPLSMEQTPFGALNIYSASPGAFITEELKLLEELAESLSFGIKSLRLENERKLIDEQLRSLDKAFSTTHLGITITDIEGKILYTNPADAEMHGYTINELIGQDVRILAPPHLRNPLSREEIKRLGSRSVESVNIRKNGSTFPVYLISDIVTDRMNRPVGFVTTCEDITERKRAEEEKRESEGRLQSIIDNSFAAIFVKDKKGYYVMANKSLLHLLQRPKEEIIGKSDFDLFPEEVAQNLRAADKKVFRTGEAIFTEETVPFPDGTIHSFITNKFPLTDKENNVYAVCGISTDITRRKEAEQETLRSNVLLESIRLAQARFIDEEAPEAVFDELLGTLLTLTESAYGFIGEIDRGSDKPQLRKGRIVTNIDWGKAVQSFYDRKAAGLVLSNMESLYGEVMKSGKVVISNDGAIDARRGILPKGHPPIKTFMGLPIYLGKSLIGMAGVANRTEGYEDEIAGFLEPFLATCGAIMDAASIREDRERAEKKLEDSHEQLRHLIARMETVVEEERKRIARDIHDELGQLLTVIKFDLSWLAKKVGHTGKPVMDKLAASSKLADSAIESVQRISAQLRPTLLDDLGIVAAMEWQASEFQKRTGIHCRLTFEPREIRLEEKLSTEIYRIFQEALTNVARHAEATGVNASLELKESFLTLEVEDNGRGIREEEISDSRSIGLIGIRERIHPWKGEIRIRGKEGTGTALRIRIPETPAPKAGK